MRRFHVSVLAALPMIFVAAHASADPQMLGVIQTASAVPLQCSSKVCTAELTSICLHEQRPTPSVGHPYTPHNPDALAVIGTTPDGTRIRLESTDIVKFAAARGFTTVQVRVPTEHLAEAGLESVAVQVIRPLTLIPLGGPENDVNRLTEADIELAAGPLRTSAGAIVDADVDTMHASQVLARMIDVLPRRGRAESGLRAGLWQDTGTPLRDRVSELGQHRARSTYNRCYRQTRIGDKTLRGCLAEAHDAFVRDLNVKYWDAVKAGS